MPTTKKAEPKKDVKKAEPAKKAGTTKKKQFLKKVSFTGDFFFGVNKAWQAHKCRQCYHLSFTGYSKYPFQ